MWKRVAVVVLAGWVVFSGNAWAQSQPNQINNVVVGVGLFLFGALSFFYDWARFVTLGLGIWLFAFSAVVSRGNPVMFWNNAMVAVTVFLLSVVGGERRRALGPPF
jgi:hypothetical protein